ncbi:MAG: hypothetical protein ACTTKI_00985 [Tannerella sp.]|uniref:hypothetical protein n=1 Tax=Tannerella sp. TaxID=2382127 RepID=UPI003FA28264
MVRNYPWIRSEAGVGWFGYVPEVVPMSSVSIPEPPVDTFGATLRVIKNRPTGASELPIGW